LKLRFFCDQCGTEVPRNTVRCPTCGRFFTAVQCPRCRFRGEEQDFAAGCPKCGYMRAPDRVMASSAGRSSRRPRSRPRSAGGATLAPVSRRLLRLVGILLSAALLGLVVALFFV